MPTLYADEDVSRLLVEELRTAGLSVTSVRAERQLHRKDDEHLLFAQQRGYVFLTHNLSDFELLHDAWTHWSAAPGFVLPPHSGVLILERADRATMANEVLTFLASSASLTGEAYSWDRVHGWARRVDHAWMPYP